MLVISASRARMSACWAFAYNHTPVLLVVACDRRGSPTSFTASATQMLRWMGPVIWWLVAFGLDLKKLGGEDVSGAQSMPRC